MATEAYRQQKYQLYAHIFRVIRYNVCFGRNFEECRSTVNMLQKAKKIWHGCWPRMKKADDVAARLWCAFGEGRQGCDCDCLTSSIAVQSSMWVAKIRADSSAEVD